MIKLSKKLSVWLAVAVVAVVSVFIYKPRFIRDLANYNQPKPTTMPSDNSLEFLTLPEGFAIHKFAEGLEGPRVIVFDPKDRMLVSETGAGRVMLVEDTDKDGTAETKTVVLESLNKPHGLAFYSENNETYLYVAETHQVTRYRYDTKRGVVLDLVGKNIATLPADGRHFSRTIGFGPNYRTVPILGGGSKIDTLTRDKLYISVGSSCDVCVENTWKRAAILESNPQGTYTAELAGGLRNSVFFAFHPETNEMWATDMGRDNLGDNLPPDEVNIIKAAGEEHEFGARRYGWPFCYGDKTKDKSFNPGKFERMDITTDCGQTEPPVIELPAHSAPLGLAFVPKDGGWPEEWRNNLLVAYHGSWNRSIPTGYKVARFDVDKNGILSETSADGQDFISGWLTSDGKTLGRPVDLKFGLDNALYISDDSTGIIYRVVPIR
ncbi:MAG: PQQ-dependent sugar dehydrogenase [Candidatus Yanofskybacteria bacterium]|nr:PQQ-dependent sugar dehydrogenase [Candidatus Yanofskybacteria bacterium]